MLFNGASPDVEFVGENLDDGDHAGGTRLKGGHLLYDYSGDLSQIGGWFLSKILHWRD